MAAWWETAVDVGGNILTSLDPVSRMFAHQENIDKRNYSDMVNRQNADLQREFAQNGIRWRVEDAGRAGLHPLYALGGSGAGASPSYQMADQTSMAGMGQDLSRAIHATRTADERAMASLQLQRAQLENELLAGQVRTQNASQVGPPMPGTTGLVKPKPNMPVVQDPGAPGREAGSINDFAYSRSGDKWFITKSTDITERTEDDFMQSVQWAIRNQLIPIIAKDKKDPIWGKKFVPPAPPSEPLEKGKRWHWTGFYYEQVPIGAKR